MEICKRLSLAGFLLLLLCPLPVTAHPMGNFSINHYSKLAIQGQEIRLDYILDFAEIPTFQMFPEVRSGSFAARAGSLADEWLGRLELTADGQPLTLELVGSRFMVEPGAGSLSTLRMVLQLKSRWSGGSALIHFADRNFPARIGWKEIVVDAKPPLGFPNGNPFANDSSLGLSRYPTDLLAAAPNVVEASVRIGPAGFAQEASDTRTPRLSQGGVPRSGGAVGSRNQSLDQHHPGAPRHPSSAEEGSSPLFPSKGETSAANDRLAQIIGQEELSLRVALLGICIAFALGALHALSPGHGKTVVASFLVGARGTARHAVFLGAIVTFTHTIGVFVLGLVVLFLSNSIVPERIYPWIGFVSGLTILGVGVNLFRQRLGHLTHDHGPNGHSHEVPGQITFRNLLALGFSGGIVPCPSALVVLLSAIALHRVGTGLVFILAFSMGLASVLVAIGILVVRASRLLSRFDSDHGLVRFVPVASAAIISVLGLAMAVQALAGASFTGGGVLLLTGHALAVLSLGLFLGLKHATDADHVIAVTTFVSQESSILRSCWIGAFWGVGHTLSLAIAGILVIGLKVNFPDWLSERLELGVAAMLVLLGANVIVRTLRATPRGPGIHRHDHQHRQEINAPHSHWHIHSPGHSHDHNGWSHAGIRPLLTGMVHGAAGSAALMLLVLSTIRSPLEAFLYILIFGLGSILGMFAVSFLLALPLYWARGRMSAGYRPVQLLAGLFSCVFGLFLGAEIWMSLR